MIFAPHNFVHNHVSLSFSPYQSTVSIYQCTSHLRAPQRITQLTPQADFCSARTLTCFILYSILLFQICTGNVCSYFLSYHSLDMATALCTINNILFCASSSDNYVLIMSCVDLLQVMAINTMLTSTDLNLLISRHNSMGTYPIIFQ